jgi:hypothetical protein
MKFILDRDPDKVTALINEQFRHSGTIAFVVQCDDGRLFVTFGDYYEKFAISELFSRTASELPRATYQEIKGEPPECVRSLQKAAKKSSSNRRRN